MMQLPGLGTMSLDHYASVIQLAALMQDEKYEEITINHNAEEDIRGKKNGKWLAFEYEKKGSHTKDELIKKKLAALEKGYEVRFVCNSADYATIAEAVNEDYTLSRGSAVTDFIRGFGNPDIEQVEMLDIGTSPELSEGMGA